MIQTTNGSQVEGQTADAPAVLMGIVRSLVASPDLVDVQVATDAEATLLTVTVHADDLATVVGAGSRTVRSLRTIVTALGRRSGQRFVLDVKA